MKTYFALADIHGFYDSMLEALQEAGFDKENPEHILIVCGDIFDRGTKPKEVYAYFRSLPKQRRHMIRGNHELLLRDLVVRKMALDHDISNGTYETVIRFATDYLSEYATWRKDHPMPTSRIDKLEWEMELARFEVEHVPQIYDNAEIQEVLNWIFSDEWTNYLELGNYIFVHSFIPKRDIYDEFWRQASDEAWEEAMWGCPWQQYRKGLFHQEEKRGKILVCGHWHTSDFYNNLIYRYEPEKHLDIRTSNPIFKSELCPGLIGLDACTALTKKINVLVLQENELGME